DALRDGRANPARAVEVARAASLVAVAVAADAVGAMAAGAIAEGTARLTAATLALMGGVARLVGLAGVVGAARGHVGAGAFVAGDVARAAGPGARRGLAAN